MDTDYRGRRTTIMGLGHFGGGAAAARWLARQGAIVTVSDVADETVLADALAELADAPIAAMHLGGHREEDFRDAELVVVNPAVRPDSPWLQFARRCRGRLVTEIELFMENCPARIIGVTGTNGKSTTAAMIASILEAGGSDSSPLRAPTEGWSGEGHLSSSPLPLGEGQGVRAARQRSDPLQAPRHFALTLALSRRERGPNNNGRHGFFWAAIWAAACSCGCRRSVLDDWVVLEISSFQLWHFSPAAGCRTWPW